MAVWALIFFFAIATHTMAFSAQNGTDQGWELLVTNSEGPVSRTCFDAAGLPSSVRGSYFIAGPAKFDGLPAGQWKYQGVFDGLGMVNRFELHPSDQLGKVCYTSAWMNTGLYKDFVKDHKNPPRGVLFEDTVPPRASCDVGTDMCDYTAPNDNNWVNMIAVGDEAVWVSDTPTMVSMDPKTLNVTGIKAWADDTKSMAGSSQPSWTPSMHMAAGGSAHPLLKPGTQHTYVDIMTMQPMMPLSKDFYIDIYTFDVSVQGPQNRTKVASVPADAGFYMHSFGVTSNHAVLPFNMVLGGVGPMHTAVLLGKFTEKWKGVHIVNLESGAVHVFDDATPFEHAHTANTFENSSGIVFDVGAYDHTPFSKSPPLDIALFQDKKARDANTNRGALRRYHFNNITKKTSVEHLINTGRQYDFFKTNPSVNGLPYCVYYATEWFHDDKSYASMAIIKHDICQNKISYWSQRDTYVGEPFFIAGQSGAEDDGALVFTAIDGTKGKEIFVVLDAQSFTELERIQLPNHIPFTAHGSFIPSSAAVVETMMV